MRVPRVEVCAEIDWALARAFGGVLPDTPSNGLDPGRAFAVARALNLVPRIGSRCSSPFLGQEVGGHSALFRETYEAVAVRTVHLGHVTRRIAEIGARLGTQIFVLKGMAATVSGLTPPGSRPIMDVDVLVPTAFCARFQEALEHGGFREAGPDGGSHHFPMLVDGHGLVVEVHEFIRLKPHRGGDFVTADYLLERGLFAAAGRQWPGVLVPDQQIQVAHALRHALVQHLRARNWHHFPAVLLGDLLNLAWLARDWAHFRETGYRFIDEVLSWDEVTAAVALATALHDGGDPREIAQRGAGEGRLLRRWLASAMSEEFRRVMAPPRPRVELGQGFVRLKAQLELSRKGSGPGWSTSPAPGQVLEAARRGLGLLLRIGRRLLRYCLARARMALLCLRGGALRWPE